MFRALGRGGSRGMWDWLWFSCGVAHGGAVISVFHGFSGSIGGAFVLVVGGWALGYHSMGFGHFPGVS